jgi:hypothetical protein
MRQTLRHIGLVLLAALYLTVAQGAALQIVQPSYTGSGPSAFAPLTGSPKDPPKKSLTTRRHLPLVKQGSISQEYWHPTAPPLKCDQAVRLQESPLFSWCRSYLYSRFCKRAPPIA